MLNLNLFKTNKLHFLVFEGESGFTTHLRGGYQVIILAEAVIVLSVCIIMKIVSKHSPFTTFVDSYTFEAWGARSRMPMLLCDLDLSEIACTPAIGSWTLTTRGTIFKWQSQESWANSIRPRKCNDWNKSTILEKNAQTLLPQSSPV